MSDVKQTHPGWAEGPPCPDECPGDWSDWHYGYSAGFEMAVSRNGELPDEAALARAITAHWQGIKAAGYRSGPTPLQIARTLIARLSEQAPSPPREK